MFITAIRATYSTSPFPPGLRPWRPRGSTAGAAVSRTTGAAEAAEAAGEVHLGGEVSKTIGKPWENHRKSVGKPWENRV